MLKPLESEISTYHNAIIFDLKAECIPLSKVTRTVFDYSRADFDGLRACRQSMNLEKTVSDDRDINNGWSNWKNTFLEAVNDFVPTKRVKGHKSLSWVNKTILYLIKKKNTLKKRMKKPVSQSDHLINKFKDLRSKIKLMYKSHITQLVEVLDRIGRELDCGKQIDVYYTWICRKPLTELVTLNCFTVFVSLGSEETC